MTSHTGESDAQQPKNWREINRRMWDERVPLHLASKFYDQAGFEAGRSSLEPFEIEEMGAVAGKSLVHLQCHFGQDTLSWARLGARVTGLDFSGPAIRTAQEIAARMGIDARFVEADLYDAPAALGERYDIVYTGLGALCWLPDLDRWGDVVAGLLLPGGKLYLSEFHPFTEVFGEKDRSLAAPYFTDGQASYWDEPGTYTDHEGETKENGSYYWVHSLSRIIQVLLDRGLLLERFSEHDYTLFARWPDLVQTEPGVYRQPEGEPTLPLMFSARFRNLG
jgi:SAM-dependent methyltransferase